MLPTNIRIIVLVSFIVLNISFLNSDAYAVTDPQGPVIESVTIMPDSCWIELSPHLSCNAFSGSDTVVLSFAEYFIDSVTTFHNGIPLLPADGILDSAFEYLTGRVNLSALTLGDHTIYIHVMDSLENWSDFSEATFSIIDREQRGNWKFYGCNLLHDSYNRFDSLKVPLRLKWAKQLSEYQMNFVTVVNGSVFVTSQYYAGDKIGWTLDLSDGSIKWQYDFGGIFSVSPPSFGGGYLVYQSNNHENDSYLYAFDINGSLKWQTPFHPQWASYLPPAISNDMVFIPYYGFTLTGLKAYDIITGNEIWDYHPSVTSYDEYPAIYDSTIYLYSQNQIDAVDINTGTRIWDVDNIPFFAIQMLDFEMPVIDTSSDIILAASEAFLNAVSISSRSLIWTVQGTFNSQPAIKDGKVYIINDEILEVYDISDGTLVNSFQTNRHIIHPPAIVNDYVFISSNTHLYALDPDDLSVKWDYLIGGKITIADNNLLLSASNGVIYCFEYDPTTLVEEKDHSPDKFQLMQNYPNPFNSQTTISYSLPVRSDVSIRLYDILGKEAALLYEGEKDEGTYELHFSADNLPSGIYFYRLRAGNFTITKKLILLK